MSPSIEVAERLTRIEMSTGHHEARLDVLEPKVHTIEQKVNAISLKWTVLITCSATAGSAILQLVISFFAKKLGLS
jgi:hypothetical protein